jgi:hypothetical protein
MTKDQFLSFVPDSFVHSSRGFGKLQIVADTFLKKAALYRHHDQSTSCWSFGKTWDEVYELMTSYLNDLKYQISDLKYPMNTLSY